MMPDSAGLFIAYCIAGPCAWALLALGMYLGGRRMNRFKRFDQPLPVDPPAVTVLVPARDEGERVGDCIESVLRQDYPRLKVIAVNDRSTDETGAVLDRLAAQSKGKVTTIHIPAGGLPEGWLGKCHALHVGSRHAEGDWLMFIDSDVRLLGPGVISRAVSACLHRSIDALSILTTLECHTRLEKLVLPLAAGAWAVMHTISLTNDDNHKSIAYANGQFFLIRRSAYEAAGGHEAVRACITEDVELMRRLKQAGFKTRFLRGGEMASTRMHATLRQMLKGWGRIYSGTARRRPWRILGAMLFILVSGFSAYVALGWGLWRLASGGGDATVWLAASVAHLALLTAILSNIYAESGGSRSNALLFPWAGSVLLLLMSFALKWCITGRIEWRGTTFDQNAVPAGRR